ncbi:hypothetical protein AgCh_014457 [Apium graveolens]
MVFSTSILLVLLFMEFRSNTIQSKKPNGNSSSMPQKTRAKKFQGPYKGARPRKEKWVAEIRIPKTKKRVWLGTHDTAEAAAQAYDDASLLLYGLKGPCNFPNNRRPVASLQMIGTKTTDEFLRIVKESTSRGTCNVLDSKITPKLSPTSHSCKKPFVPDQLDHGELTAHLVTPEPIVATMMCEVEPYVPELDFTANKFEVEPYFPYFAPEEEPLIRDKFPVDEALIKGSDDWIMKFIAKTLNNND